MLDKLFFKTEMTWKRVILFAIITAVFSAAMLIIPFTVHTSLANPGTYPEFWLICALIIVMNCHSPLEAGIKTFVFFLISQPLIYLLQVPFSWLGWQIFMYYPRWFVATLLTFPIAMVAYLIKKDNVLSAIILSLACALLTFMGMYFLASTLDHFPHMLLSVIFCFASVIILIRILLKKKKNRIIASVISILSLNFGFFYSFLLMGFALR